MSRMEFEPTLSEGKRIEPVRVGFAAPAAG